MLLQLFPSIHPFYEILEKANSSCHLVHNIINIGIPALIISQVSIYGKMSIHGIMLV